MRAQTAWCVDFLWQLWFEDGHNVDFNETDMPTWDGTVSGNDGGSNGIGPYSFDAVDPDDIRNSVNFETKRRSTEFDEAEADEDVMMPLGKKDD